MTSPSPSSGTPSGEFERSDDAIGPAGTQSYGRGMSDQYPAVSISHLPGSLRIDDTLYALTSAPRVEAFAEAATWDQMVAIQLTPTLANQGPY